jgi:hypothetical protein
VLQWLIRVCLPNSRLLGMQACWTLFGVATEAALSLAVLSYNLLVLFQQKPGWQHERITTKTLRY